jgi:hypothetical protein
MIPGYGDGCMVRMEMGNGLGIKSLLGMERVRMNELMR